MSKQRTMKIRTGNEDASATTGGDDVPKQDEGNQLEFAGDDGEESLDGSLGGGVGGDVVVVPPVVFDEVITPTPAIVAPIVEKPPVEPLKLPEAIATVVEELPVVKTVVNLHEKYKRILSEDELAAWDTQTLQVYADTGVKQDITQRGNYPQDRRRNHQFDSWTTDALLDWMDGRIDTPSFFDEDQLWDELYRRYRFPTGWTRDAVRTYVHSRKKPGVTSNGTLIEDRVRDTKELHQFSYKELRAALLGEIQTRFTKDQLLLTVRTRMGVSEKFSETRLLDAVKHNDGELTVEDTLLQSKLDEYFEIMGTNQMFLTETTAGIGQTILAKAIFQVMNREPTEFYAGWTTLLDYINTNYNTLFEPGVARRGMAYLNLKGNGPKVFESMLTLLIHTRDPVGRARAAKQYNLETLLTNVTNERARDNVVSFYHEA